MPVRSRGSLLAGTIALAGLFAAGAGCQSNPAADHDAFATPNSGQISSGLFSHRGDASVIGASSPQPDAGFAPAPPVVRTSGSFVLQPAQAAPTPANQREVIASSWEPVQRVSAEQPVFGPAMPSGNGQVMPAQVRLAPMPAGSSSEIFLGGTPAFNDAAPPAGNVTLPAPRVLASPPAVAYSGAMPAPHGDGVPREFEKMALPPYVVEPPDVLLIQASNHVTLRLQRIEGPHLVGLDGTVNLGIYGQVRVSGMTLAQIADAVANVLLEKLPGLKKAYEKEFKEEEKNEKLPEPVLLTSIEAIKRELQVDVLSYNSKYYYVITDGGGYGQQVYPILVTGNETVLDALAKVNGLPAVASKKKIWLARATRAGQPPKVMPVDWRGVSQCGASDTNYQIFPGDRVFVQSDVWLRADSWLSKRLSPLLRGFGATLLGASTVNVIKSGGVSSLGASSVIR